MDVFQSAAWKKIDGWPISDLHFPPCKVHGQRFKLYKNVLCEFFVGPNPICSEFAKNLSYVTGLAAGIINGIPYFSVVSSSSIAIQFSMCTCICYL